MMGVKVTGHIEGDTLKKIRSVCSIVGAELDYSSLGGDSVEVWRDLGDRRNFDYFVRCIEKAIEGWQPTQLVTPTRHWGSSHSKGR